MRGITEEMIGKLLRWYAKQPRAIRIDIHQKRFDIMNSWQEGKRAKGISASYSPEVEHDALITAIRSKQRMFNNRNLTSGDDLELATKTRIEAIKLNKKTKPAPIKNQLTGRLQALIVQLRGEGLSWEKISDYIALHHKKRISRGYLCRIYSELEQDDTKVA